MNIIPLAELRYRNVDFEIADIFPENWAQRKEFSLYYKKERPISALFFVCSDIEVTFASVAGQVITARHGDIVFIPKKSRYRVSVLGKTGMKIDTYTINFKLLDESGDEALLGGGISILTNRQDNLFDLHLKNLFDTFYRIEKIGDKGARNMTKTKGEFFILLDLIAESESRCKDFYYPIRKGVELFCEEWNLNERIEKYASVCGMSETYFYRCFRKWSGSSPIEYRNMLRLSNAESMLRCTDMKISEISQTVGFVDPFYFCRAFSQKFGASPKEYRKSIQSKAE